MREDVEAVYPDILPGDYFECHMHGVDVVRLVLLHNVDNTPATLSLTNSRLACIDMNHIGGGDVVGKGPLS